MSGDVVLVNYTVYVVDDGERVFESGSNRVFVLGRGQVLGVVEDALRSMSVGEKRELLVPPERGYGVRRDDLVVRVPVKQLQRVGVRVRVGEEVDVGGRRGVITRVTERFVYIDLNHPLAGKTLKVVLELVARAETPADKARFLAARMLGLDPSVIEASYDEEGRIVKLKLPAGVIGLPDLDSRLRAIAGDVYDVIKPGKLTYTIEVEYPEEAKPETPQTQQAPSESGTSTSG